MSEANSATPAKTLCRKLGRTIQSSPVSRFNGWNDHEPNDLSGWNQGAECRKHSAALGRPCEIHQESPSARKALSQGVSESPLHRDADQDCASEARRRQPA